MYSPTYFEKRLFLKIKQAVHKYIFRNKIIKYKILSRQVEVSKALSMYLLGNPRILFSTIMKKDEIKTKVLVR